MRYILWIFVLISFAGCATTQQPNEISKLQIKVAQLEKKVEDRDQEISDLKYEIQRIGDDMAQGQEPAAVQPVVPAPRVQSTPGIDPEGIIRVSADPQEIQKALKNAGFYNGNVDGKIGAQSKAAIQEFQRAHNLNPDGVIGKKTWAELQQYLE